MMAGPSIARFALSPPASPRRLATPLGPLEARSRSQPRLKPVQCALDSLVLQPVGTSDHYLERCYCYLCTCGKHICPADLRKEAGSPRVKASESNYQHEFTGREAKPSRPFLVPAVSALSMGKMDLRTTSHTDFQSPGPSEHLHYLHNLPMGSVKFVTRSSYQRDFPNWRPGEAVLFKTREPPYRGNIVGFKHKTTYQEDYEHSSKPAEHFHYSPPRQDPITVLNDFYGQTSSRSQYQPHVPEPPQRSHPPAYLAAPQGLKLTTTYRQEFPVKEQSVRVPFKQAARNAFLDLGKGHS